MTNFHQGLLNLPQALRASGHAILEAFRLGASVPTFAPQPAASSAYPGASTFAASSPFPTSAAAPASAPAPASVSRTRRSGSSKRNRRRRPGVRPDKHKLSDAPQVDFTQVREQVRQAGPQVEQGVRSRLLDSFVRATHGNLASCAGLHVEALEKDPLLYGHLARWYHQNGAVRDHNELFVIHLLASPFPEHRDNGIVLLQYMRPYQVARVVRYTKEVLRYQTRALRTAVKFFLHRREADPAWFDEIVIRDRHSVKYLYATLHIKPGPRAQQILFQEKPPADSRVNVVGQLARLAHDPAAQARLILDHKIQFTTAMGTVKQLTPAVLYALVSVMTPQQVINHMKFFQERGALDEPRIRALVEEKIRKGQGDHRVSDFKAMKALSKVGPDPRMAEELLRLTNDRIQKRGSIDEPTALLVDKSGSMQECIEIGKMLACVCSTITRAPLYVTAFDGHPFPVNSKGTDIGSWTEAFRMFRADGCTSIGAGLCPHLGKDIRQVVIISDGEENTAPYYHQVLQDYEEAHHCHVRTILVKVQARGTTPLEQSMAGRDMTVINFDGDYYNLPNIVPLLCHGGSMQLIQEVLDTPLYTRDDLATLPAMFDPATCEIRF